MKDMIIKSMNVETFRHKNSRCIAVEFEDGTGCSVVKAGKGQYASNQMIPDNWNKRISEIEAEIQKRKEKHDFIFDYPCFCRRDETGVFPKVLILS